jgi:hypothetical protein
MDMRVVRSRSLAVVRGFGYPEADHLPLLDEPDGFRPTTEIVDRCLALTILVAHAYGWSREEATARLDNERLWNSLTGSEQTLLAGHVGDSMLGGARQSVESLWILTWALGFGPTLRFDQPCPNNLVELLPDLKRGDDFSPFRAAVRPRRAADLVEAADIAYLVHWAFVDAHLKGREVAGSIDLSVIENRRRALDWILLPREKWEEISLDT